MIKKLTTFVFLVQIGLLLANPRFKHAKLNRKVNKYTGSNNNKGPFCQSLVGYYVGQFTNKWQTSFNAEFQIHLEADQKSATIGLRTEHWDQKYSKSDDFYLDFYYGVEQEWCDVTNQDCYSPFVEEPTYFKLDINHEDGTFYHLMYFDYFNNSFALNNAGCPINPWTKETRTTELTSFPTPVTQITTQSPLSTCNRQITIVYDNSNDLSVDLFPKLQDILNNRIFNGFVNFKDLALGVLDDPFYLQLPGTFASIDDVKGYVNATKQIDADPDITIPFEVIAQVPYGTNPKQTVLFLVGSFSYQEATHLKKFADMIKDFAWLSMIGLQDSVDWTNFDTVGVNYWHMIDLAGNLPHDFEDIIVKAFGCQN